MSLLDAFMWLGATPPGQFLKASTLAFALTESSHILGIALLGGAVLTTNLSAAGLLFRATPPQAVAQGAGKVFWTALGVMAVSGVLLVSAGPFKYYSNPLFPVKLALLAAALVAQLLLWALIRRGEAKPGLAGRALAIASLVLWLAVLIAGRWLGLI
jgi:hypothetical protein